MKHELFQYISWLIFANERVLLKTFEVDQKYVVINASTIFVKEGGGFKKCPVTITCLLQTLACEQNTSNR
jgi:hypothetical protein